jgi:hypothetical protein
MQHQEITNQKLPSGDYVNAAVSAIKPRIAQIIIVSVPVIAPVPWPVDFDKSRLANAQKVVRAGVRSLLRWPASTLLAPNILERLWAHSGIANGVRDRSVAPSRIHPLIC